MNTTENNKLIAEFMQLKTTFNHKGIKEYYQREYNSGSWYQECELKYHTEWNSLMPVIKKIRKITLNEMSFEEYEIWREDFELINPFNDSFNECYEYVLKFIKWYNKQN